MGRSSGGSFRFEKGRLLRRSKTVELWDGWIDGHPHLIKRFLKSRSLCWHEYALLSRVKHSILPKPTLAGYTREGSFCYGMPVECNSGRKQEFPDLPQFSLLLLSLIYILQKKKIEVHWNPDHIFFDSKAQESFIAGMHPVKGKENDTSDEKHLTLLCAFAAKHLESSHPLLKILRKWMRRKEFQLSGCLAELYSSFSVPLNRTIAVYEWPYTRELELIGGLYRLAEQEKGRLLVLQGEAGEGKTTLLRQIYSDLILRDSRTIFFPARKEERTLHSAKALAKLVQQSFPNSQPPRDWTETAIRTYLIKVLQESKTVTNILVDNFHNFDTFSKVFLLRLFQELSSLKVLFVVSSNCQPVTAGSAMSDFALTVPLQKPLLKHLQDSVMVPLWQEKQRKYFMEHIYQRTSGNPLFFQEYLSEAFRSRDNRIEWQDGEWRFARAGVPDFPAGLLEFYWNNAPELDPDEISFLEVASLKGEMFDPSQNEVPIVQSLIAKNVLMESEGRHRFRRELFSEAIQKRLSPERTKEIHRKLASELSHNVQPDSMIPLAHHYMKAGEPAAALQWVCRSIDELGYSIEPSALKILSELEPFVAHLTQLQRVTLFRRQGNAYVRRGKFAHAAVSYRKAIESATDDPALQFHLGVLLAECHILQEDIVSAQHSLSKLGTIAKSVTDEAILFRYYIARGVCSHYNGPRNQEDFQKAFDFAESLADDSMLAHAHRRCAWLSLKEGKLVEASRLARKALRHAKIARDTEEAGNCYKIFASIAWRKSRHDLAEKMMKKSIRAFQRTQNEFGCAGVWNLLGNVYLEKYKFIDSARCFEKAVALFGHLDHSREVSLAQFNMGLVYLEQGRLKEAEKIFLRCRSIDKVSGNKWFYAYDLRAIAVYCILQGYPRKATRLLKRTLEICEELKAEGDILQTKMILLFHHLDQGNYREAQPVVRFLEQRLDEIKEPLTEAEIHHLLAYYYGFLNDLTKAGVHLKQSLSTGRRIRHYKLIGKNKILSLIFRGTPPRQDDREFARAISNFRKSKNQLEFADYLLKFYRAYPALIQEKSHQRRIRWMDSLYRNLRIRPRYQAVRKLTQGRSGRDVVEPVYGWWQSLLSMMSSPDNLKAKLQSVLKDLSSELHCSFSQIHYLNEAGTFERVFYGETTATTTTEELSARILERTMRKRESLCLDASMDPELSRHSWVLSNEVRSVLAIPFFKSDQFLGLWYFERRKTAPVFTGQDLQKASFFSTVCSPWLEKAMDAEATRRIQEVQPPGKGFEDMIAVSPSIQDIVHLVQKVAPLDVSVLISGESGTGKELIARNIHRLSQRAAGPFIALNCSAIPETLIESELFGHARGAFTGAVAAKPGSVERAHRGTLFLDEIGDLSSAAQAKLLRVIQEREVQRVGETSIRKIDVRFLFATHRPLERLVQNGEYREDLYYRITGYTLTIPPLRERKEDIPVLVRYFTEKYSRAFQKESIRFSTAAMKVLCDYPWPGNIREMENLVQTVLVNCDSGGTIEADALPRSIRTPRIMNNGSSMSLEEGKELFERDFVLQALTRNQWNKSRTAKELKITRQGLINMIQRLRIEKH
jgi:transcriptional regulator with GAF, ATPase, and Fis domain/tetratricopeptide (TPR) repeat protein